MYIYRTLRNYGYYYINHVFIGDVCNRYKSIMYKEFIFVLEMLLPHKVSFINISCACYVKYRLYVYFY